LMTAHSTVDDGVIERALGESGSWAICRHDSRWPSGLTREPDGPRCLIGLGDPGQLFGLSPEETATIVGARRATTYGTEVARRLGGDAARAGLAVVSGMAIGIDGAVHRGSLGKGRSIAVLGGSADRPYPATNRSLYRELIESGAVVSELPPGTGPRRWCFPARNRTMASMAGVTVVVEAAVRSGSLITAEMALSAGREVGAVPGPVTSVVSAGCNELLRSGAALIRDGVDLIETLAPGLGVVPHWPPAPRDPVERAALGAISSGSWNPDLVVSATGCGIDEVMGAITALEMDGLIEVDPAGRLMTA
jgi:DNA processing protein